MENKKKRVEKEERTKNLYINKEGNQQQKQQPKRTNNNNMKQSRAKETIHFSTFCFRPCPAKAVKGVGGRGVGGGGGKTYYQFASDHNQPLFFLIFSGMQKQKKRTKRKVRKTGRLE